MLYYTVHVPSIHNLHVYNNVFRLLLNQPEYCSASTMFVEYHVPDSKAVIRNLVYKFMLRLDASCNKLVIAIINSDTKWQSWLRRHWIKMLYIHNNFGLNVPLCNIIFLVTCIFNVYVWICMIVWNKDIELNNGHNHFVYGQPYL